MSRDITTSDILDSIGIDSASVVYGKTGDVIYDGTYEFSPDASRIAKERILLAELMIERWSCFKRQAEDFLSKSGK